MTEFSRPQSARLYEQVVAQIETQILNSTLRPGDRLPNERELADQFRVSRTVIREAVKTLREKGLISSEQGRGTFVTDGTSRAARDSLGRMMQIGTIERAGDLVEAREMLEPEIAALASTRATPQDLTNLNACVEMMDRTINDANAFIEADLAFHLALARATQNAFIPTLLDPIVDLLREHRKKIFLVNGAPRGQSHHKKIFKAIVARDPDAARAAMRAHLKQVRKDSEQ
jgi:GntR family transcriptional regulator, transcriptional repressor for pyruvate dehydrogenase complex